MSRLPEHIDPWRAVEQSRSFAGTVPLKDLPRLSELLLDDEGELEFQMAFYRGEKRRACVRGTVKATVRLTCQRCLQAMEQELDCEFNLALVKGLDEAAGLSGEFDPLMPEEDVINPLDLIEDELLLALPQIPKHGADTACGQDDSWTDEPGLEEEQDQQPDNPFQVLQQLKDKLH